MGFELGKIYQCKVCGHISPLTIEFDNQDALKSARDEFPKFALNGENQASSAAHTLLIAEDNEPQMGILKMLSDSRPRTCHYRIGRVCYRRKPSRLPTNNSRGDGHFIFGWGGKDSISSSCLRKKKSGLIILVATPAITYPNWREPIQFSDVVWKRVGAPEVDARFRFRKCPRLLNPGTPRHPRSRVGLLHSWPHLIPRRAVLADSLRNPFYQPESLGGEVSSSTVATSTARLRRPRASDHQLRFVMQGTPTPLRAHTIRRIGSI